MYRFDRRPETLFVTGQDRLVVDHDDRVVNADGRDFVGDKRRRDARGHLFAEAEQLEAADRALAPGDLKDHLGERGSATGVPRSVMARNSMVTGALSAPLALPAGGRA